ncbi:hypothetical protein [Streptomyces sp. NPDC059874]|uniref:hypothetical protein n=1 Tax=Streptomyces sp. NPDC059874 TaxID=3346983 RepID=UPI00365FE051
MTAVPSDVLSLSIDSLTLNEIEAIEDIIDGPLDGLAKPGAKKAKLLKAMAYVIKRRDNPEFTIEDAGNLRIELKAATANPLATNA